MLITDIDKNWSVYISKSKIENLFQCARAKCKPLLIYFNLIQFDAIFFIKIRYEHFLVFGIWNYILI